MEKSNKKGLSLWQVSLVSGGAAGICVDVSLYPVDTIKTRLQAPEGFFKAGGFKGVYNGVAVCVENNTSPLLAITANTIS
eukprot:m.152932 g.152932  ORF g.152932 m.152932 type:complete len:80 (-) comp15060_c0_seq1:2517-2756(-)